MAEHFDGIFGVENVWPVELSNVVGTYMTSVITRATPIFPRPRVYAVSQNQVQNDGQFHSLLKRKNQEVEEKPCRQSILEQSSQTYKRQKI